MTKIKYHGKGACVVGRVLFVRVVMVLPVLAGVKLRATGTTWVGPDDGDWVTPGYWNGGGPSYYDPTFTTFTVDNPATILSHRVVVANGDRAGTSDLTLGPGSPGHRSELTVTGADASLKVTTASFGHGSLYISADVDSDSVLTVAAGAAVLVKGETVIGSAGPKEGGTSTVNVTDAGSILDVGSLTPGGAALMVGSGGPGVLNIQAGGTVRYAGVNIGNGLPSAPGTINVSGAGSSLVGAGSSADILLAFEGGAGGTLNITQGATVSAADVLLGQSNSAVSSDVLLVDGAGSKLSISNVGLIVGDPDYERLNGAAQVMVSNGGAILLDHSLDIGGGNYGSGTVMVTGTGSTISATDHLNIVTDRAAAPSGLTIANGGRVAAKNAAVTSTAVNSAPNGGAYAFVDLKAGGTLELSGTLTAEVNALFSGAGTLAGDLQLETGATVVPGDDPNPGALTVGSTSVLAGNNATKPVVLMLKVPNDPAGGAGGTAWSQLAVSGSLDFANGSHMTVALAAVTGDPTAWDGTSPHTWSSIVTTTGGVTGVTADSLVVDASGFATLTTGATFAVVQNGNNLDLVYVPPAETPTITSQPQSQSVTVGASVTFTLVASGTPSLQWRKDGLNLSGQTGVSLTLNNVLTSDAGTYTVVATNSAGSATSNGATLTVSVAAVAPAITTQPSSESVALGGTATFSVAATGSPPPTYSWWKDGVMLSDGGHLSGAGTPTLLVSGATAADAGKYTVTVSNSAGSATGSAVTLTVGAAASNSGRIINMSVLTSIAPVENFTFGYFVGGSGTIGVKPILMRAMGPSLAALGVGNPLSDPFMECYDSSTKVGENDNWGGDARIIAAVTAVQAFSFAATDSKDAAIYSNTVATAVGHSIKISGVGSSSGTVIAELYDVTPGDQFTATTPRLINVSLLKNVGDLTTMGFFIGGSTSVKVLVRAVGPTLAAAPFKLVGTIADPKMSLFQLGANTPMAANDDWGNAADVQAAGSEVGAFPLAAGSKDAAMIETLPPGGYTVQVVPSTDATGIALLEIYEVP